MNIRKITDRVYYVGINDRTTWKFENLWPLPNGVSYNSYLVIGEEKVALIDTVEEASMSSLIAKIKSVIKERTIDYLVVNHMEPDHSGGIPEMIDLFPDLQIVGNKQTIGMVKGFYDIPDKRFLEIKDNDTIDLGNSTLQFVLTPMVHWPETMMTYLKENGVLFSGDAFGCFGALNGGVVDKQMATETYFPEMYRYYSNIVGKYGKPVQMALKKTSNLDINYICSTHGPVWHDKIDEVLDIYNRLSLYEGENGVTIVYGSMYGNTGEIAETIATRLNENGIRNIKIHNVSKSEMSFVISDAFRYKGLIVGSPTYNGRMFPQIEEFIIAMESREIKNKIMATFGSFTWASAACKNMNECISRLQVNSVATMDMKQSPKSTDIEAAIELADKVAKALGY
ncbi:MAG: FprA family A-type flavoprotein [Muribaculaceae bacterium]|nr:FprA family A-type flavoprotein [Muribaculaceae bacterium]